MALSSRGPWIKPANGTRVRVILGDGGGEYRSPSWFTKARRAFVETIVDPLFIGSLLAVTALALVLFAIILFVALKVIRTV